MNDTAGISKLQQQYNELVAEFSKAYPREITDNDGQKIKIEFVELRKDIRTSGSYLSLGFVPLFQHTYMDINILEARSEQKARLFAGSFTPVRQIPYSVNKYNAHQGKKECERRQRQRFKQLMKDPLEFAKVLSPDFKIQPWQAEVLKSLGIDRTLVDGRTEASESILSSS